MPGVLCLNYNQDGSCFTYGSENGFRVFSTNGFRELISRKMDGGLKIVEMINRSNIFALVGGGRNPVYSPNKVIIWDDYSTKIVRELTFQQNVLNVKLSDQRIYVVLRNSIWIYELENPKIIGKIATGDNPAGLIALSQDGTVIAYPSAFGEAAVQTVKENHAETRKTSIKAHKGDLVCISLSRDGKLLATASTRGTLIRLFDTNKGTQINEFRRGMEPAQIYGLFFDDNSTRLACSSNRGTVHVFSLSIGPTPQVSSVFSYFKNVIPGYLNSKWSFKQFYLPSCKNVCCFRGECLVVITYEGKYYRLNIDDQREVGDFMDP